MQVTTWGRETEMILLHRQISGVSDTANEHSSGQNEFGATSIMYLLTSGMRSRK